MHDESKVMMVPNIVSRMKTHVMALEIVTYHHKEN